MNSRELKTINATIHLIERVNQPLNSPGLGKLQEDLTAFYHAAPALENIMKPVGRRRLTQRKEQV